MSETKADSVEAKEKEEKFIEGLDFYFESGFMVLTEYFLKNRGYCCGSGCRHCPYPKENPSDL